MSLIKHLAFLSFCAITLPAHARPYCPGNIPSLPLRFVAGVLIVIPLHLNGLGPYEFVVDTGAQVTTVDASLAAELGLRAQGTTGVSGVATYGRSAYAYLNRIEVGQYSVPHALVVIDPLAQLRSEDSHIRGILAENFLQHFDLLIDNGQHFICLDDSTTLASSLQAEHIALTEPYGATNDMSFTKPIVIRARLSAIGETPLLLRLDSGSNTSVLYRSEREPCKTAIGRAPKLRRVVEGTEQVFAVLPEQELQVGTKRVRQLSVVVPMNPVGVGPAPREDGLLPTMAFQRVFISHSGNYVSLEPWKPY